MKRLKRVLVAMSGGVDSSVAAAILKEQGYEVIGATMKIWPKEYCTKSRDRACCSLKDIEDARKVSRTLGIKHYVLNFEKAFQDDVIDYFTREYMRGRTPNPCIVCNEKIKFGSLLKKAEELECDFVSTGHYARIEHNGNYRLMESIDKTKDQSYVLFSLGDEQLSKSLFPIGNMHKKEVRLKAKALKLGVYKKADSQEICFVMDGSYSDFIKRYCGMKDMKGDIVDSGGRVLGQHNGFWNFTIGQRKGLGISYSEPLYVISIVPEKNIVSVGSTSEVKKKKFIVKDLRWFSKREGTDFEALVKIRYMHKKKRAKIKALEDESIEVEFLEDEEAITPGQASVFYEGEYVIGGGWIENVIT